MSIPLLIACVHLAAVSAEPVQRPAEASSLVRAELVSLEGDVWGGDGDGIPAVFHLYLRVTVHNDSDEEVRLEGATWSMPVGGEVLSGSDRGLPLEVPPGEVVELLFERYLSYEQVRELDEGVRSADERRLREVWGRIDFTHDGDPRYTVFTLEGRWRGAFDPRPPRKYDFAD